MGNKLNNELYKDLVNYSEEFKEFLKKEFIKYHKISEDDYLPIPKLLDDSYSLLVFFIFNNDGTIDI